MPEEISVEAALSEQVDALYEDIDRLTRANTVLRKVNSALRRQLSIAQANDETFKEFCQSEITVDAEGREGGLPEGQPS
jgi:regulator of replication initiation timing